MSFCVMGKEVKIPVIQGGMGIGVSMSSLAGAVAKGGGVGVISAAQIGFKEPDFDKNPLEANLRALRNEIVKAKKIAPKGVIGVNIMVAMRYYQEYVKEAVKAGVDLIISGAGLPVDLPKFAQIEGCKTALAPIVSSVKSLQVICKYWLKKHHRLPDMIIVEGPLAGGHLGFSLEDLDGYLGGMLNYEDEVKRILNEVRAYESEYGVRIPVVLAGGIYDVCDMKKAMELGIDGVQIATRFVTTYECDAAEAYKQTYIDASADDIVLVKSPVGMPGRAIANNFLKEREGKNGYTGPCRICLTRCDREKIPYCITQALIAAANGNKEEALLFCGSNAYKATKIEHVADIMEEFAQCVS
ncbi:MAG: nitronate monooxygenase family protein [Lachnospiraceae bacterium]